MFWFLSKNHWKSLLRQLTYQFFCQNSWKDYELIFKILVYYFFHKTSYLPNEIYKNISLCRRRRWRCSAQPKSKMLNHENDMMNNRAAVQKEWTHLWDFKAIKIPSGKQLYDDQCWTVGAIFVFGRIRSRRIKKKFKHMS